MCRGFKLTDKYLITTTSKRVAFTLARKRFLATLIASLDPVKPKYFGAAGPAKINLEFLNPKHWCPTRSLAAMSPVRMTSCA